MSMAGRSPLISKNGVGPVNRKWGTFLALRVGRLAALLVLVSFVAFWLLELSPIDPVNAYIGADMLLVGPEQRAEIRAKWGLDKPPLLAYGRWVEQVLRGDLGTSRVYNRPVADVIREKFGVSLVLLAGAWLLSGLLGFGLGILAGVGQGGKLDQVIRAYVYLIASVPTFWLAMILLIVVAVQWKLAPICCAAPYGVSIANASVIQRVQHLMLPLLTLTMVNIANILLHTRQKVIESLQSDYVLFARAQGETTFGIVRFHLLRNISIPFLTLLFASITELIGGSVLTEQIFAYPGLGQATVQAGLRGDVPLLMGITLFTALLVFGGSTLADLLAYWVNPQYRIGR